MKKQDIFMLVGAVIFSISLFAKVNKEKQLSDLALENVEALSAGEPFGIYEGDRVCFDWNGQLWSGDKNKSALLDWFPKYDWCREESVNGHQVYCTDGDGNCWNGTGCIPD